MWRLSWYSFRDRVGRATLVASVLALTVALLGCLYSMARTVANTADALAESAGTPLQVLPRSWLTDGATTGAVGTPLDEQLLTELNLIHGVEKAQPQIMGRGIIPLRDDGSPYTPSLVGTQSGSFEDDGLGRLALVDGKAPVNPGEVVIDPVTLAELGHEVGDEVLLVHDATSRTLSATIVGVVELDGASPGTSSFVMLSPQQAQELFLGGQQGWNAVALELSEDANINTVNGAVNSLLPYGYVTATATAVENAHRFWLHPVLTSTLMALAALGVLVVLACIALTNTAFGQLVRAQNESLVSLRVMGASRLLTWKMVMAEGLVVGLAGSAAGVLLAALLEGVAHGALAQAGMPIGPPSPGLGVQGALSVFAIGMVCSFLAANQHALAATRTYPVTTKRYSSASRWLGEESWTGIGLIAVALWLMFTQRLGAMPVPLLWSLLAGAALVAGSIMACSMAGRPALARLTKSLPGTAGALTRVVAHQATQRPHRLGVGVATLAVASAVLAAGGTVGASGMATAQREIPDSFAASHVITNERGHSFSPELTEFVAALPGVSEVNAVAIYHADVDGEPMQLATAAPEAFPAVFTTSMTAGRAPAKANEVMVSAAWAEAHTLSLDDLFRFSQGRQRIALRIVGIFEVAGELNPADAVTVREAVTGRGIADVDTWLGVEVASPAALEEVSTAMAPIIRANPLMMLTTPAALGELEAVQVSDRFRPATEFFQVATVAGAFGLALLLALSVLDRRRDYGSLIVMGASQRQLVAMVIGEGVLLAGFGITLGLVSGTVSGWAIQHSLADQGFSALVTPAATSLLPLLLALPVGALAAAPAAVLVRRVTLSDSLPTR